MQTYPQIERLTNHQLLAEEANQLAGANRELARDLDKSIKLVVSLLMATTDAFASIAWERKVLDPEAFLNATAQIKADVVTLMTDGTIHEGRTDEYALRDGDEYMVAAFEAVENLIDSVHAKQQEQKND